MRHKYKTEVQSIIQLHDQLISCVEDSTQLINSVSDCGMTIRHSEKYRNIPEDTGECSDEPSSAESSHCWSAVGLPSHPSSHPLPAHTQMQSTTFNENGKLREALMCSVYLYRNLLDYEKLHVENESLGPMSKDIMKVNT